MRHQYKYTSILPNLGIIFWILTFFLIILFLSLLKDYLAVKRDTKSFWIKKELTPIIASIFVRLSFLVFLEVVLCCLINYSGLYFESSGKRSRSSAISVILGILALAFFAVVCSTPILHKCNYFKEDSFYFNNLLHGLETKNLGKSTMYLSLFLVRRLVFALITLYSTDLPVG